MYTLSTFPLVCNHSFCCNYCCRVKSFHKSSNKQSNSKSVMRFFCNPFIIFWSQGGSVYPWTAVRFRFLHKLQQMLVIQNPDLVFLWNILSIITLFCQSLILWFDLILLLINPATIASLFQLLYAFLFLINFPDLIPAFTIFLCLYPSILFSLSLSLFGCVSLFFSLSILYI